MQITIRSKSLLSSYPARQHAQRVAKVLGVTHGLLYLESTRGADELRGFEQERFFYYLSGVNEADCHITYDIAADRLLLWLPNVDLTHIYFYGNKNTVQYAKETFDIDDAQYIAHLPSFLKRWRHNNTDEHIRVLRPGQGYSPEVRHLFSQWESEGKLDSTTLLRAMLECRVLKDSDEIKLIQDACNISAKAHTAVLRSMHNFTNERQIEACFLETSVVNGAKYQAYSIIAAAGANAATLHYSSDNAPLKASDMVCLDAGAEFESYASDVTRTFPVSGQWPSAEAKAIYYLVQEMQTAAIRTIKPGSTWAEAFQTAVQTGLDGLVKLGIFLKGSEDEIKRLGLMRAFFPHALGHHVGLDVHDPHPSDPSSGVSSYGPAKAQDLSVMSAATYETGMVVTVEPGLYFNRHVLKQYYLAKSEYAKHINAHVLKRYMAVGGVRIEDVLLVTKSGYMIMSHAPKGECALSIIRDAALA